MKKCASCTKDLPDAALHCVFCGAKQPPAPAPVAAKTIMGYGGQELDLLRKQAADRGGPAGTSTPAPMPRASAPAHAPPPQQQGAAAHTAGASAGAAHAAPASGRGAAPAAPAPTGPAALPIATGARPAAAASAPLTQARPSAAGAAPSSVSASATGAPPVDPWQRSLRVMMLLWGALLLAAFATPLTMEPLTFHWDLIQAGPDQAKLPPLIMAGVGVLCVLLAAIPLASAARGAIAMVLGLAGIVVPIVLAGAPAWQSVASIVGVVLLVAGLLARHEYREASLPRVLVTLGAIGALVPWVVPANGGVPLVELFERAIDAPAALKLLMLLVLVQLTLFVLALLAWMPAPASAGAKVLAWLLILWPLFTHAAALFLVGDPSMVEDTPFLGIMGWVAGAGAGARGGGQVMLGAAGLGVAYLAIVGYGAASVIGDQLEA